MKLKFLGVFAIFVILFQTACVQSDTGLTKAATDKLADNKIVGVTVVVRAGVATLTGKVADVTMRAKAEAAIKSVIGVESVINNCTLMDLPTDEPVTDETDPIDNSPKGDLNQQAQAYAEEYTKPRIANCGDSYFILVGKNGLHQIKDEPFISVYGRINPAKPGSEADKLNGKSGRPDIWYGSWQIKMNDTAWRYYRYDHWEPWRDDTLTFGSQMTSTADGGWDIYEGRENPQIIPKHKCAGNDIDMALPR